MAEDALSPRNALQALPMGQQIQKLQEGAENARDKLKAMSKALSAMVATAQDHYDAVATFADSMALVAGSDIFQKSRDLLMDQASKRLSCVRKQEEHMTSMIKDLVESMQAKVHEAIKEHEGASEKVHALKKGSPKLVEAQLQLSATQQQMDLLSFAYVNKLSQTNIDVSLAMLDKFSLFFGEETVLFMSVNSSTAAIIPELTKQQAELKKQRQLCEQERAKELKKHENMSSEPSMKSGAAPALQIKQGLIFCRISGKYRQRWCSILNARLFVYKHWQASDAEKIFNLVLCNVKRVAADSSSHPFVFEIRSHMDDHMQFAATDELEMTQWIHVIQNNIASQLTTLAPGASGSDASSANSGSNATTSASDAYQLISRVKGNEKCADCRAPDPEWIAYNLGITICIECSGVHRSFGSHISKVRSMKLDALDPELVLLMTSIGNAKANTKVFEHSLPPDFLGRPGPTADRAVREAFLKAKYVEKRWIPVMEDWQATVLGLMRRKHQFKPTTLLSVLVQPGADINWKRGGASSTARSGSTGLSKGDAISGKGDTTLPKLDTLGASKSAGLNTAAASSNNQRTILHKCVMAQNFVCAILLLKRECQVDPTDASGMTPLHIAAQINAAPMVRLLLQHGASLLSLDASRKTPKDVAVAHDSLDCVWLLSSESDELGDLVSPHRDGATMLPGTRGTRTSDPALNLSGLPHAVPSDSISNASSPPNSSRGALAPPSPPDQVSALSATERHSAGEIGFVSPHHRFAQSNIGLTRTTTTVPTSSTLNQSFHTTSTSSSSTNANASKRKPSPSASVSSATSDVATQEVGTPHATPSKRPAKDAADSPLRFQSLSLRSSPPPKEIGIRFDDDSHLMLSARKATEVKTNITSANLSTTEEKRTNMRRSKSAKSVPSNVAKAPLPAPLPEPIPFDMGESEPSSAREEGGATGIVLPPPTPKDAMKESRKGKGV